MAQQLLNLAAQPALFKKMSKNAADRVRKQSNFEQTIGQEIDLLRGK